MKKLKTVRIGIAGAAGRMGRQLLEVTKKAEILYDGRYNKRVILAAALEHAKHKSLGRSTAELCEIDAKENNRVFLANSFNPSEVDVFIDFSTPEAVIKLARKCRKNKIAMVVGVTGFSKAQEAELLSAAKDIPLVVSPNMSSGVLSMFELTEKAAKLLELNPHHEGGGYDVEICETHHRNKKDAPSGTALRLGKIIAQEIEKPVEVFKRDRKGKARRKNEIGYSAIRGGDVIGEHRVIFSGTGEQIEIIHRSTNRMGYASGAVRAAMGIAGKKPGLYSIEKFKKWE